MQHSSINGGGEVVLYEAPDGQIRLDVRLEQDTVWLTQAQMAELFGRERSVITKHIRSVFREGELEAKSVCANFARTAEDGKTYQVDHYSLDVVISVGYRVKSKRGTQFRIWATRMLRDHLLRGYTLNEKRLRERGLGEIEQAVGLLARTLTQHALVTDEGRAVLEVVHHFLGKWRFDAALGARPGVPIKPDPGAAAEVCRILKTPPESFLYLGDTNTDMITAGSAGMFAVGVLWGFRTEEELRASGAQALIHQPLEVLGLL